MVLNCIQYNKFHSTHTCKGTGMIVWMGEPKGAKEHPAIVDAVDMMTLGISHMRPSHWYLLVIYCQLLLAKVLSTMS